MKLGILGTGTIVQDLLHTIGALPLERVELLTTPRSTQRAAQLCSQYRLSGMTTDYDALLTGDIDTIYVALPNHLHFSFARKALMAGKHVIVEKPIAVTAQELDCLHTLATERGLILLEAMNLPHQPAWQALKDWLPRVGRVRVVCCNFSKISSRYAAFLSGQTPPAFDPKQAGGALMDLNVYNLYAITGLFGRPKGIQYQANIHRGIDTGGVATLQYDDMQVVSIAAKDCTALSRSTIQGEKGVLVIDQTFNALTRFRFIANDGAEVVIEPPHRDHRLCAEFLDFIRIIESRDLDTAQQAYDHSLLVCQLLEAARRQAGLGF